MKKENLIFKIIAPFLISLFFVIFVTLSTLYYLQKTDINQESIESFKNISEIFRKKINDDTELFINLIQIIQKDETIVNNYKNRNRDWLFLYLHQIYLNFQDKHNVTHIYIHDVNKTNFLRVHNRDVHSDKIERNTLNAAFNAGAISSGIELGIHRDFSLRVVSPWYYAGELIGYVEIGKDIEQISKELSHTLKTDMIFTINKDMTNEDAKQQKSKDSNNSDSRYIKLENFYIIKSTLPNIEITKTLLNILDKKENILNITFENQGHTYNINSESVYDMLGNNVGKLHVLSDMTAELNGLQSIIFQVTTILSIIIAFMFFYYYRYIKQIKNRLSNDKKTIELNFKFEHYVNKISSDLFVNNDIDNSINNTLKNLGEVLNANRAYLFLFKENYSLMDNTHEWCANGVNHEIDNLRDEATEPFKWWLKQCKELKPIIVEDINKLPLEAANEKLSLQKQQIKSLMVYQIVSKGTLIGFVGIDMVEKKIKWSETHHSFVKITAEAISLAFDKKTDSEKIIDAYDDIALTLNSASNGILVTNEYGNISLYNKNFIYMWEIEESSMNLNTYLELLKMLSYKILNYKKVFNSVQFLINNHSAELTFITFLKNGKIFEISSMPRIKDELFKGRVFTFRDVTKKIAGEKELELAAKVFENSLDGIIISDSKANIIKANNSFLNITGYEMGDIIGHPPSVLQSSWHDDKFYNRLWNKLQKDSIWEGEIKNSKKNGEMYISLSTIILIKDNEENITNYICIIRDITKIKESQERIEYLAYYDSLTNLPNRALFMELFKQGLLYCKRNKRKSALLFIDLDSFKYVNDTYGHQVGDLLLKKVSTILSNCVRTSDTVSRLSGDEFTVIVRNIDDKNDIITIADKIIEKLSKPIIINNISLNIGSSIGASIYPDDAQEADKLIKIADSAMYKAKENGKNRLEFS